ncbi:MAG TPA: hypothetical protein PLM52_12790 [Tabrizicola sp.]|jgi:hypothetical protein|nr:hypothetical protein [Tabrizicola sp.]
MEWVIWGFGGLAALVAAIIGVAAWIVLRRDRNLPNAGIDKRRRPKTPRSDPTRGVPKSR